MHTHPDTLTPSHVLTHTTLTHSNTHILTDTHTHTHMITHTYIHSHWNTHTHTNIPSLTLLSFSTQLCLRQPSRLYFRTIQCLPRAWAGAHPAVLPVLLHPHIPLQTALLGCLHSFANHSHVDLVFRSVWSALSHRCHNPAFSIQI